MKKALGYVLMILSGFMLLAVVSQHIEGSDKTNYIFSLIAIIFIISIFTLGRWLVKKSKTQKNKVNLNSKNLYFDKPVELNVKLTFKEYWQGLLNSFPILKTLSVLVPCIGLFQILEPLIIYKMGVDIGGNVDFWAFEYFNEKIIFVFITILPLIFFLIIKLSFKKNLSVNQNLFYQFKGDSVCVKGNNFESKLNLHSIDKIKITRNQILFFFTKNVSNIIPKRVFQTTRELENFISVLDKES